jgi:serine-type D-Ala-D-Ala carboxypeptidase (penicillin-binding protein 5/6)
MKFQRILILTLFFVALVGYLTRDRKIEAEDLLPTASLSELPNIELEKKTSYLDLLQKGREVLISKNLSFLEANLDEMMMKYYDMGNLSEEIPILTKGDPLEWGGSPAGIHYIINGSKEWFSSSAQAYMPYALKYYGKYFFHGEPYYEGGSKIVSNYSGGCLRLKDENAKKLYNLASVGLPVLVVDKNKDDFIYPETEVSSFPSISAKSFLVADLDNGYILADRNIDKIYPIASITKLMTAVAVTENIDLNEKITVENWMLEGYGSTEGVEIGRRLSIIDLLYPLLIESSNNAAEIISHFFGRERTIELMNEKAETLFMKDTSFADPSGFKAENVSTVKDLFYLARYILNNRTPLFDITRNKKVHLFNEINYKISDLWNKNVFCNDPTFLGGKTGFIKESRYTGVFTFRLKTLEGIERNIAIIVLRSEDEKRDTQNLYIWLIKNYFQGSL